MHQSPHRWGGDIIAFTEQPLQDGRGDPAHGGGGGGPGRPDEPLGGEVAVQDLHDVPLPEDQRGLIHL